MTDMRSPWLSLIRPALLIAAFLAHPALLRAEYAEPAREDLKLPGLVVNFNDRRVDVEATVCLNEGMLELVACTKGSKEHESLVTIEARPMHVHAALLALGARNGQPATSRPMDEQETRWIHLPPHGDPVKVSLVLRDPKGEKVEHSISEFVRRSEDFTDGNAVEDEGAENEDPFSDTFIFAGSHLGDNGKGPRTYIADISGSVISISTFGDELLCMPGIHANDNDALMWQANPDKLPKVGTKVTLRLRPQNMPASQIHPASNEPGNGSHEDSR